ncbi:hypothetical protein CCACVL1_02030 [Corchorus capsularis]|uniref:Uncharacterized protein n=1 Tax=Corchorus capsularis TaxID=210143 RepID=A0A1R3KDQ5_COCAP|nr:hypothetical protein CCACVL1_02030 [Corchorus capsularis]
MNIEFYRLFRPPYYPVSPYFVHVTGPEGTWLPVYEPELNGNQANGYVIHYRYKKIRANSSHTHA